MIGANALLDKMGDNIVLVSSGTVAPTVGEAFAGALPRELALGACVAVLIVIRYYIDRVWCVWRADRKAEHERARAQRLRQFPPKSRAIGLAA